MSPCRARSRPKHAAAPRTAPNSLPAGEDASYWNQWLGYNQLSRFTWDPETSTLDLSSEREIIKVDAQRGQCCHVGADMAWDADEASRTIGALRALGVGSVEQPIPPENLDGLARLVRETGVVIMADEGLTDRGSLQTLIARRACSGANIRITSAASMFLTPSACRMRYTPPRVPRPPTLTYRSPDFG